MDLESRGPDASSAHVGALPSSVAAVLLVVDRASNILGAEGEGLSELGLSRARLLGRAVPDALDDRPDLQRCLARALANEEGKLIAESLHGTMELLFAPTRSDRGEILGAVLRTPSFRPPARADHQKRDERRRLRMIFRQVPGAVWTVDHDLRVTQAAGRLAESEGLSIAEVVGATIPDLFGKADPANPMVAHHRAALAGESTSFRHELRGHHYQVQLEPLRDPRGQSLGAIGVAIDVTRAATCRGGAGGQSTAARRGAAGGPPGHVGMGSGRPEDDLVRRALPHL